MTPASLKQFALGASLCSCLVFTAHAENSANSAKADAVKPASTQAAKPADTMNLNEKQKAIMTEWSNLQKQHYQSSLQNQIIIEDLASAEHYDQEAVNAAANKIGKETEQYQLNYANKNREFVTSLSPEQRIEMEKRRSIRKEQMQKKQQQLEKAYSNALGAQKSTTDQPATKKSTNKESTNQQ